MPALVFPHKGVAYFLHRSFVPVKNPMTGRVTNEFTGQLKWVASNLWDPVERQHAHNHWLSLWPGISQEDRDKVASMWADIRYARETEEKKKAKLAEEKKKAEEEEAAAAAKAKNKGKKKMRRAQEKHKAEDQKWLIAAMLEESEHVAANIAKVESGLKGNGKEEGKGWWDVVMGD